MAFLKAGDGGGGGGGVVQGGGRGMKRYLIKKNEVATVIVALEWRSTSVLLLIAPEAV